MFWFVGERCNVGDRRVTRDSWAHGVVVSRLLRMQKALGSNPSGSIFNLRLGQEPFFGPKKMGLQYSIPGLNWGPSAC